MPACGVREQPAQGVRSHPVPRAPVSGCCSCCGVLSEATVFNSFSGFSARPFSPQPLIPMRCGFSDLVCGRALCGSPRWMREIDPNPAVRSAAKKNTLRLVENEDDSLESLARPVPMVPRCCKTWEIHKTNAH